MPDLADGAVGADEFAALMTPLGPFESRPCIAIACSGGRDSMALTLLMREWATARGGAAMALIVDHALRPESASEAKLVAAWLESRGIASQILCRTGAAPTGDLQATARAARYRLLSQWCAASQCLHLAIGHHLEDQAETFLLRLARGSGVDGLAAMAPVSESRTMRMLRPLLPVPSQRLGATLARFGMRDPIDDPSNRDPAFARVRMRGLASSLAGEGMTARRLAGTAARMARARHALEGAVAGLLAQAATLHAAGYCVLETAPLRAAPPETALRALARVLSCIGGRDYPPRLERLERLHGWIMGRDSGRGRTLGGCRVIQRKTALLICREPAAATAVLAAKGDVYWDNRFRLRVDAGGEVRRLGADGWRQAVADAPRLKSTPIPAPARPSLPAIWAEDELLSVPHLDYRRRAEFPAAIIWFSPKRPLITARFTLQ